VSIVLFLADFDALDLLFLQDAYQAERTPPRPFLPRGM